MSGKELKNKGMQHTNRALSPFEEMDQMFNNFFPRGWLHPSRMDWFSTPVLERGIPRVDVIDRDDEVMIRAELPGVAKKDLDVSVSDNSVTIKGSTNKEVKEEKGDYFRSEISHGSFTRTVALPSDVNSEKVQAEFKNGILELLMPKVEKAKKRTIKID
jgi:HSP20 family protein